MKVINNHHLAETNRKHTLDQSYQILRATLAHVNKTHVTLTLSISIKPNQKKKLYVKRLDQNRSTTDTIIAINLPFADYLTYITRFTFQNPVYQ